MDKKVKNLSGKRKRTATNKKNVKKFESGWGKKIASSNKGSWFDQDVYCDQMTETTTKRKIILPEGDSDSDYDIYSGSSLSPYLVVDFKL